MTSSYLFEEADGSNRDVIISIEEADGSNQEVCTEMERRQFGLDKRRTDLDSLSNGYIQTEAIYAKATPLKKVDDECITVEVVVAQKRENQ
ncbi:hypothetical protein F511_06716 [Dorcoceras hygrometricum]|uniref:Uncharacterized protein n=1 Tax=Dorcoceras hygrometricum TaxID=472368 RepID=A0A2Z7A730_9LAMI|nr:hypothetical protein F511_06716 [Dorcoceras hygrometricum]